MGAFETANHILYPHATHTPPLTASYQLTFLCTPYPYHCLVHTHAGVPTKHGLSNEVCEVEGVTNEAHPAEQVGQAQETQALRVKKGQMRSRFKR